MEHFNFPLYGYDKLSFIAQLSNKNSLETINQLGQGSETDLVEKILLKSNEQTR